MGKSAIKRAIIICWIMLIVCFIIKLFGGNWFKVVCNNEHFIQLCAIIDKHYINYALAFGFYIFSTCLITLSESLIPNPTKIQLIIIISSFSLVWFSQFINMYVKTIIEAICFVVFPVILNLIKSNKRFLIVLKKTWFLGLIGYALNFAFQFLSLITKNIGLNILGENSLIAMLLLIDYYIMIILYYCYVKLMRKEYNQNGNVGTDILQQRNSST